MQQKGDQQAAMKITQSFVYRNRVSNEEGILDTWGVAAFSENSECFLCPDISVERAEAKAFAELLLRESIDSDDLQDAANVYIDQLYNVS